MFGKPANTSDSRADRSASPNILTLLPVWLTPSFPISFSKICLSVRSSVMRNRSNCCSEFLKRLPRARRAYGSERGERTINNLREPGRPSFACTRSLTFIPLLTLSGRRLAGRGVKFAKFLSEKRPRKYQIAALGVASFASSIVAEFKGELRGFLFRERARIISDLPRSDPAKSHVQALSVAF